MLLRADFVTTPLHCDMSDAVNIMFDVSLPGYLTDKCNEDSLYYRGWFAKDLSQMSVYLQNWLSI